jgi:type I site-specific restriction endonuclease
MNEAETRAELIDPALKAAGWGVVEGSRILREYRITAGRIEGHGRRGKADIADYVLVYRNAKLAVVEAGKVYEEADFNRSIEIREREQKRVEIFLSQINPNEKTLVFCANQAHALVVRDLINQLKAGTDPNYCHRVTADDGALGEQHLRDFQDNEKSIPTILTTSQKLSTGVDARNVRNIVLMRPVNSMIEFKQIIGRGTRLFDGKDYFTIYDFVKAHLHFSDPEWDGEPMEEEPCPKCGERPHRLHLRQAEDGQGEAGRREGAHDSAHDDDDLLASRRQADVGAAVHGAALRQVAGVFPQ